MREERDTERERDTGEARFPRNQAERLVRETGPRNWSEKLVRETGPRPLASSFIVQQFFNTLDNTWRSMDNTKLCSVRSPDSFYTSFCVQKVSGDLHYLLAKRLVNTFWLSSLMNINFVSPEVFFFNLHLFKALKLHLYRTKVQWVITKKVLNSKI